MMGVDLLGDAILRRSADFARPGVRRVLRRDWAVGPRALVIGCNPSLASAEHDDPTCRWWTRWFAAYGFGGFDAVNLYPFVATSPTECRTRATTALTGGNWGDRDDLFANLDLVVRLAKQADQVFVCWGAITWDAHWIDHVVEAIQTGVAPYPDLWCWGTTTSGAPKHPMARGKHRIAADQTPILWKAKP